MASPTSVTTFAPCLLNNPFSEENRVALDNEKKRKRRLQNKEAAERSRRRKKQQLDDLNSQASQLQKDNSTFLTALAITREFCNCVEAESNVLRTQRMELINRLQSLNQIIMNMQVQANNYNMNTHNGNFGYGFVNPWNN